MVKGIGHTRGSMNPWAELEDYYDKPNWKKANGHETPYGAMAELLQNWPGTSQTSEQDDEERHLRLVSVISGYPEVQTGRRPLDMPLHEKSELAFELSNFIDKVLVSVPDCHEAEWHSLRTYMIHYDLINSAHMSEHNFLHFFMKNLRTNSTYDGKEYPEDKLHHEEVSFLTVLHSQSESRKGYWPLEGDCLKFKDDLKNDDFFQLNAGEKSYIEHEFKFDKIHDWIDGWASPKVAEMLDKNIRQKWIVAASSILESTFAKLRSHIIKQKRPGSIVVDGGGRISFISKKQSEEERLWFRKIFLESFLMNQEYPHPFDDLITNKIKHYASKEDWNQSITDMIKANSSNKPDELWKLDDETEVYSPTRLLYNELIGKESAVHFLPQVVVGFDESGDRIFLHDKDETKSWHFQECIFCNGKALHPQKRIKHYVKQGEFVCPFHYIFRSWANQVDVRHSSNSDLFSQQPIFSQQKNIKHILVFDGNSIGLKFTKQFTEYKPPVDPDALIAWNKDRESILDIKTPWAYEAPINLDDSKSMEARSRVRESLHRKRSQPLIRKQRRSFNFNVNWWLSLRKAIGKVENCNLRPWILAGDDVVFASRQGTTEESIIEMLHEFQSNLSAINGITFAGALQTRNSDSIIDCFHSAKKLEADASIVWKKLASQKFPHLINETKKHELERDWEESIHSELFNWLETNESNRFKFCVEEGPISIIIPSNWKDHSSS